MNRLNLTFLGGDPLTLDDLEFLQNALIETLTGVASVFQNGTLDPIIVSGINFVTSGSNYIVSNGYIIYNKEFYYVEGGTFPTSTVFCIDIAEAYDSAGNQTFEDLTVNQTWIIRRGKVKGITGGPGEIDIADFISLKQAYQSLGILFSEETLWTNLGLQTTWLSYGGSFGTPRYRKDKIGHVELDCSVKNVDTSNGSLIAQLPVGFRPLYKKYFAVAAYVNGINRICQISIDGTGNIIYAEPTPSDNISYLSLSGIRFPIN